MSVLRNILFFLALPTALLMGSAGISRAAPSAFDIARPVSIEGGEVKDGSIVSLVEDGSYALSSTEYEEGVVGVISLSPDVSFEISGSEGYYPLVTSGTAYVLVNNSNGTIRKGDYITSSSTSGVGMKAEGRIGIVGQALEDAGVTLDSNETDLVLAYIGKKPPASNSSNNFSAEEQNVIRNFAGLAGSVFGLGKIAFSQEPSKAFRYILSVIIVLFSMLFGFLIFGRIALGGLEAIGRNPLARTTIMAGIILNIFLSLLIIVSGIVLSYFIITY